MRRCRRGDEPDVCARSLMQVSLSCLVLICLARRRLHVQALAGSLSFCGPTQREEWLSRGHFCERRMRIGTGGAHVFSPPATKSVSRLYLCILGRTTGRLVGLNANFNRGASLRCSYMELVSEESPSFSCEVRNCLTVIKCQDQNRPKIES